MSYPFPPILSLLALLCIALLSGCGGGGLPQAAPPPLSQGSQADGTASFAVKWPDPSAAGHLSGHLIPAACNSILLTVTRSGQPVTSQLIVRPTASVTLSALPVGTLSVAAAAYPTAAGTGVVQASATTPLVIAAGSTTPLTLTLTDTVTTLTVTSPAQSLPVGGTLSLVATARDATGAVVLTGGSITWSSSNAAVSVNASGVVSGAVGDALITATDSESGVSGTYILYLGPAPIGSKPTAVSGTIQCENYDVGGEGVGYHDTTAGNASGAYRSDDVDIENCSDTGSGYDISHTAAGEWLNYTVTVATARTYTVGFRVACPSAGATFHLENSAGTNLTGTIACPNTGGYQTWQTVSATVTLPAGFQTLKLVEDTGGYNLNYLTLS